MKKILFILSANALVLANVLAQESSFSLLEAQNYAIKHAPMAKMSELEIEKAKSKVWEIKATGLPQVSASAGFQNFINIPISLVPASVLDPTAPDDAIFEMQFGTNQNANAGISATQLIFNGSYLVGLKSAKAFLALSEQQQFKSENDIKAAVANAYYIALVGEENRKVLQESLMLTEKTLQETKLMYDAGFVEEQDFMQLELLAGTMTNNLDNAIRQTGLAYDLLKFQMGIDMQKEISLKDNLKSLMEQANPELIDAPFSINKHPELMLAKTQLKFAELNLSNERSKYLPTITGFFSHSVSSTGENFSLYSSTASGKSWFPGTLWGLNLNMPIFSSGQRHAVVQQASLDHQKALILKNQVKDGLEMAAKQAKSDYAFAIKNLEVSKRNLDLATEIRRKTLIKFKEGISASMELTQADRQFQESQSQYIGALFQLLNAKTKLDKALSKY